LVAVLSNFRIIMFVELREAIDDVDKAASLDGMPAFSHRSLALVVVLATLIWAWPKFGLMWAIALVDGIGLVLIYFPDTIDDLTFGTFTRGGQIDAHTPPWMIAGIGWILIILMVAALFRPITVYRAYG
jgi:hypothetical protein